MVAEQLAKLYTYYSFTTILLFFALQQTDVLVFRNLSFTVSAFCLVLLSLIFLPLLIFVPIKFFFNFLYIVFVVFFVCVCVSVCISTWHRTVEQRAKIDSQELPEKLCGDSDTQKELLPEYNTNIHTAGDMCECQQRVGWKLSLLNHTVTVFIYTFIYCFSVQNYSSCLWICHFLNMISYLFIIPDVKY